MMLLALLASLAMAGPLSLDAVLDRVDERVPGVAAADAGVQSSSARARASRANLDPMLGAAVSGYRGYKPRELSDAWIKGETWIGPRWMAGHRRGAGDFPSYAEEALTDIQGELYVRLEVPLLEGLGLSTTAVDIRTAGLAQAAAKAGAQSKRIEARRAATLAYWDWVSAGVKLGIAEEQLEMAEERQRALQRQVATGARAPIDLVDNERVLLERRSARAGAEAEVEAKASKLGLYFRDASGRPMRPSREELPAQWPAPPPPPDLEEDRHRSLAQPGLEVLRALVDQAGVRTAKARNGLLPKVDAYAEGIRPLGGSPAELVAGAKLEISSTGRLARARRDEAEAKEASMSFKLRGAEDSLAADLAATHARWRAAARQVQWARQAAQAAEQMVVATERRYELGTADLFDLLLREGKLASTRKAEAEAELALRQAEATRSALVGELPAP